MACAADQVGIQRGDGPTKCHPREQLAAVALPDVKVLDFSGCAYGCCPCGSLGTAPWADGNPEACCSELRAQPVTSAPQFCRPEQMQLLQFGGNLACSPMTTTLGDLLPGVGGISLPADCPDAGCRVEIRPRPL
jgi:hypothetical protein